MSRIAERLGPEPYGGFPGYKEQSTSKDAARASRAGAGEVREAIYAAILGSPSGLTADEASAAVGRSPGYGRPRVSELAAAGRIVPTGQRRKNNTRLSARVWRAA